MKKYIIFSLAIMLALFSLTACGSSSIQDTVSAELGIDVSGGEELSASDTHGGFHGDGASSVALSFSDSNVLDEIKENTEWKPFPLDETVQALVYGVKDETSSIGPFINDGNGNPLVREIQNGYYILIDRQEDQETDILDRPSFNVTVGLYDTDTNTLYCCTLDT